MTNDKQHQTCARCDLPDRDGATLYQTQCHSSATALMRHMISFDSTLDYCVTARDADGFFKVAAIDPLRYGQHNSMTYLLTDNVAVPGSRLCMCASPDIGLYDDDY